MPTSAVPEDKRYRISLLLDAYGGLLTEKQRTFLKLYYENDLSFGEIAAEQGISRQAIFDSVRHGEHALEAFEAQMQLVGSGWAAYIQSDLTPGGLLERLEDLRGRVEDAGPGENGKTVLEELDSIIEALALDARE